MSNGTATPAKPIIYQRITSKELASGSYTTEFLIEGAMVAGQPMLISGPKKALKTSFIVDAAVSLATGGYFLGRLPVNKACRVTVMSGESGLATLQETAHRVCVSAKRWLDEVDNLIWSPDLPMFARHDHLEALEKFLTDDEIEVLFIDPAYLAMPGNDAGNLFAQGALLQNVSKLCQSIGVTLSLVHHNKKSTGRDFGEPAELEDIAWSGFQEFARQWWLLARREYYQPGTGEHRLWLTIGGSAGHSALYAVDVNEGLLTDPDGRRWEVSLNGAGEAREQAEQAKSDLKKRGQAVQLEADIDAILDAAAHLPDQTGTKTDLQDFANLSGSRRGVAVAAALKNKQLFQTTMTKENGQTYEAYTIKDPSEECHPDALGQHPDKRNPTG